MARDTAGSSAHGGGSDPDGSELESTARRSPRASRTPGLSRRARARRSRTAGDEADTTTSEISSPPPTAAGLSLAERSGSAFGYEDDWDDDDLPEGERSDDRRGARLRWIMVTAFLALTVLSLTGVAIYLTDVVEQWEQRSDELTEANYELGDKIASQKETIASKTDQIDILTEQLNTAQDRISELASQSANSDDDLAYAEQRLEILSGYASTGAAVANALVRCLDSEEQLVEYLANPDDYDEDEVAAYAESVDELCTAARESNSQFQALLTE
ncbi:hypothetical protein [Demequina sp. NBRC 110054]|uniref:hypothetical protein n=1 Tax=Demequina sp. NBRC 110054 TaxID=1570343 RepID=UPI000A065D90|nr:hypothetical protein [Demequina sp. NBRC 110054]